MSSFIFIFRIAAAIVLAIFWVVAFPIYSPPFGGCEISGYLTLQLGCSDWPQFLRGFGVVLIAGIIAPKQSRLHYVALGVVFLATPIGGFEGWRLGYIYDINNISDFVAIAISGTPLAIGGFVALVTYLVGKIFIYEHKSKGAA